MAALAFPQSSCRDLRLTTPLSATITWSSTPIPTRSPTSHQPPRDAQVLLARLGIAARMVVHQHHAGGRVEDRRQEHLARVNDRGVEASDRDRLARLHLVTGIEQQHHEVLAARPRQIAHVRLARPPVRGSGCAALGRSSARRPSSNAAASAAARAGPEARARASQRAERPAGEFRQGMPGEPAAGPERAASARFRSRSRAPAVPRR